MPSAVPRLTWPLRLLAASLLALWLALALWLSSRHLPPGVHISGPWLPVPVDAVRFLYNQTAADAQGQPLIEQQIDTAMLQMIARARELLVLDTGLFGDLGAAGPAASRLRAAAPLAAPLAEALLRARGLHPGLAALVLTDRSSVLMDASGALFGRLRQAGIQVLVVDEDRLRSPDGGFAALWSLCCRWWTATQLTGAWPNPLMVGPARISFGLWGALQGYQRSHRQLLIADDGAGGLDGLVFSRPLHAEAGLHSASALQLAGSALEPVLESEFVLAQFSGWHDGGVVQARAQRLLEQQRRSALPPPRGVGAARARVLTEGAIAEALVRRIDGTGAGDRIAIAALYFSQRELVRALLDAARRGVAVRVLLDPGKDGYGFERSGLPNRQVSSELIVQSEGAIRVRWYRTHGEQFSPSVVLIQDAARDWLMVGTASLSRYDLDDFNLSSAFVAELPSGVGAAITALAWFDTLWYNRAPSGVEYTSDADVYADASQLRYWQYRTLESTGVAFF
ncbi:MAG TPA: phospholipase D-like domain-containing protein [Steroidobacteraceae bacterium]|nr:phospholipase D-like domain-containing protein [Steroidobacteraceae bacterium]